MQCVEPGEWVRVEALGSLCPPSPKQLKALALRTVTGAAWHRAQLTRGEHS